MIHNVVTLQDRPPHCLAEIPGGDPAERCVADLMLALLACHLRLAETAQLHVSRAKETIDARDHLTQTLRGARDTWMVRVVTRADDLSATLLLPAIDHVVIVPEIAFETAVGAMRRLGSRKAVVTFGDIAVDHVKIRVRAARVKTALQDLCHLFCPEELAAGLEGLLRQCVFPAPTQVGPLEKADELFELAAKFARLGNRSLAQLALQRANANLRLYACATEDASLRRRSEGLTLQITDLVDGLRASAS